MQRPQQQQQSPERFQVLVRLSGDLASRFEEYLEARNLDNRAEAARELMYQGLLQDCSRSAFAAGAYAAKGLVVKALVRTLKGRELYSLIDGAIERAAQEAIE